MVLLLFISLMVVAGVVVFLLLTDVLGLTGSCRFPENLLGYYTSFEETVHSILHLVFSPSFHKPGNGWPPLPLMNHQSLECLILFLCPLAPELSLGNTSWESDWGNCTIAIERLCSPEECVFPGTRESLWTDQSIDTDNPCEPCRGSTGPLPRRTNEGDRWCV